MHRKLGVLLVALALVAGACGGGKDNKSAKTSSRRTTTTESDTSTTVEGGDGATTTTAEGVTTTTTGKSTGTTAKSGTSPTANPNAAPAPAQTGTYDYAQSGSANNEPVPPNGTLVVSGSGPDQVFHRYVDPAKPPSDIYFSFRDDGPFITRVVVRQQAGAITCTFNAPVPAPPWPATNGRSFSGHATCDNGFVADFSGTVGGHTSDSVGGQSVDTVIVNSTLHITGEIFGTPVDVTVSDTQHWAPSLRLSTFSHETVSGNFSGDVTAKLKSTSPR